MAAPALDGRRTVSDQGPAELLAAAAELVRDPSLRFALGPADRPLVEVGQRVAAGDPLVEQARDVTIDEARLPSGLLPPTPGRPFDRGVPLAGQGRRSLRFDGSGRVLYTTPAGVVRVAIGQRAPVVLVSPVDGEVQKVDAGAIVLRAAGLGVQAAVAAGTPALGRLVVAVPGPDAELSAAAVDVGGAGAILVAGSRLDLEVLVRARAMGLRGVVAGGAISRDLRGFAASDSRQRAALDAGSAFGVLVFDGYGKRPIPSPVWALLRAAEGRDVGLATDPPLLILPADLAPLAAPADRVRVAAGELLGREGRFLAQAGRRQGAAGLEQPMGRVLLDAVSPAERPEERLVALADLERFA